VAFAEFPVRDLRQSRRLEIVSGSKPYSLGASAARRVQRISRDAVQWSVSHHPNPLPRGPRGEGEPCSVRTTIQSYRLSTARGALFPLPEGEGPGEGETARTPRWEFGPFTELSSERALRRNRRFPKRLRRGLNGEFRMSNIERMTKHEIRIQGKARPFFGVWISGFFGHSSFVICHWPVPT